MAKRKSAVSGLLTVVVLLVLTALAAVWYSGDGEQNNKMNQSALYQKVSSGISAIWSSSGKLADVNINKNVDLSTKIQEEMAAVDFNKISLSKNDDGEGFSSWSEFVDRVKEEWEKEGAKEEELESEDSLVSWERSEDKNFLVITLKNGTEYKVPVSTKWLTEKSAE